MKLFLPSKQPSFHHVYGFCKTLRVLFLSTHSPTCSSSATGPLRRRILWSGDVTASVIPVLEKWLQEGKDIKDQQLQKFIRTLRYYRRFSHALEISQWMCDKRGYDLSATDVAIRLDLISKVRGIEQAEIYFNTIPNNLRGFEVYGALLNCYAHNKCLEKAEATMRQLWELGFVRNAVTFNVMLSLYSKMGKYEKIDVLIEEMEVKGISCNRVTYNIQLKAYAANSNIEEMEKLLMKMEADPVLNTDWYHYVIAAKAYLNTGVVEKALTMLKRSEQLIEGNLNRFAYEHFLTLYTAIGNKDEVHRLWNLYKSVGRFYNSGFLHMIDSLTKLDDVDGAERIWEEWLSKKKAFDVRIPNVMIAAYARKGLWQKAEACVRKIVASGVEPLATTLDLLATAYHVGSQMEKAIETVRKAISVSKSGWKPNIYTLTACLEYLKSKGDVEEPEELLQMLREHCDLSTAFFEKLKNCIDEENLCTRALDLMKGGDRSPPVMESEDESCIEL